ncbi:MAG: site-specific integrase [Syntrophales bacterium LBB04]|nr:site-specific integrase [Syntrophales bacterium LBB04]
MPRQKRFMSEKYPGVYYAEGISSATGKSERIYYIIYRKNNKLIEEKAGRQFQDHMTFAQASRIRAERINGNQLSNKERRQLQKAENIRQQNIWTIDRLWSEYKSRKPDLKSLKRDENRYKKHILPNFGHKEPFELSQFEIDKFKINLLKTLMPQTVKLALSLLFRIINFGVKKQLCEGLKFKIEMPKVYNIKTEDLSPAQLQKLLQILDQDSNIQVSNLMKLALYTGMRRGELFRLQWSDIDFNKGFIRIVNPKGGKDQTIPLNHEAKILLLSHPRTDSAYIFPGRDGGQRHEIIKQANRIKELAQLPKDFRALHGLRHVYASLLASSGQVDMYTLQKLLTHKSPQMTQRYAHLRDESLRKASNLVGDLINNSIASINNNKAVNDSNK